MTDPPLASSALVDWSALGVSAGLSMVISVLVVCVYSFGVAGTGRFLARRRGTNGPLAVAITCFAVAAACVAGGIYLLIDKSG